MQLSLTIKKKTLTNQFKLKPTLERARIDYPSRLNPLDEESLVYFDRVVNETLE
jgi:hypothetical protein